MALLMLKKSIVCFAAILTFNESVWAQGSSSWRVGTPLFVYWDYDAADITAEAVNVFHVQIDANAIAQVPIDNPDAGTFSYSIPAEQLGIGPHIARVRACSTTADCSDWVQVDVTIKRAMPRPRNPRHGLSPPTVLSIAQAIEVANAWSILVRDQRFSEADLAYLASRYGGGPPYKESILEFLEAEYARLLSR